MCHHGSRLGFMIFFPGVRTQPRQSTVSRVRGKPPPSEGVSSQGPHPSSTPRSCVPNGSPCQESHGGVSGREVEQTCSTSLTQPDTPSVMTPGVSALDPPCQCSSVTMDSNYGNSFFSGAPPISLSSSTVRGSEKLVEAPPAGRIQPPGDTLSCPTSLSVGAPIHPQVHTLSREISSKPRMLDLFSGSGSVAEFFSEQGFDTFTVDYDPKFQPDIRVDILVWEYQKEFPPGFFDVIGCCPPCTEFSQAMTRRERDFAYADALVKKGLEIIQFFQPKFWFLENPQTGKLKSRPYMKGLHYVDLDYCQFSDWGYQKRTRVWGSPSVGLLQHVRCDRMTCPNMQLSVDGQWGHIERLGRTPSPGRRKLTGPEQYGIPKALLAYVLGWTPVPTVPFTGRPSPHIGAIRTFSAATTPDNPYERGSLYIDPASETSTPLEAILPSLECEVPVSHSSKSCAQEITDFFSVCPVQLDSSQVSTGLPEPQPATRQPQPTSEVIVIASQDSEQATGHWSHPDMDRAHYAEKFYSAQQGLPCEWKMLTPHILPQTVSEQLAQPADSGLGLLPMQKNVGSSGAPSVNTKLNPLPVDDPEKFSRLYNFVNCLNLDIPEGPRFDSTLGREELECIAEGLYPHTGDIDFIRGAVEAREPLESAEVEVRRKRIYEAYKDTVFTGKTGGSPPIRGPFGEAVIKLKPDAKPISHRPFQIVGERKDAWVRLTDEILAEGKIEPGVGPWNSASFPVPKKKPGEYRLVEDFRDVNNATEDDGHPLPRIDMVLQRQGKYQIWSTLDLKDGYHQMPLKPEHRYITCMSTPRGTMQWRVLVMGLKNGNAMFQRMMEWVLRDHPNADAYVDDVIIGSFSDNPDDLLDIHEADVTAVLETLARESLVADFRKVHLFVQEVEFCGHVLKQGRRGPAPGKLLSIQGWELPKTVTQLRGFLGLTNYYSCYVPNYAELATPLLSKLQLNRVDGKKGSQKPIRWTQADIEAFVNLKRALTEKLELFQLEPDHPFVMKTDASDNAIGAVLEQEREGKLVPVAFFSRKLASSQRNWTPREKETYAIVSSLRKWAGWIGFQPVLIQTDHRSLEDWVSEHVDTPSGPRGRRARWHETLSQFNLQVQYMPGKDNIIADAMSRYAYPASSAREDVSFHGSATAHEEMKKIIAKEIAEGRLVGLLHLGGGDNPGHARNPGTLHIAGLPPADFSPATHVQVITTKKCTVRPDNIQVLPLSQEEKNESDGKTAEKT